MAELKAFSKAVQGYIKAPQELKAGRRMTLTEFAREAGFGREEFSKKLNGQTKINEHDVRAIILGLARLKSIKSRNQARRLLQLMDISDFAPQDWQVEPLRELENDEAPGAVSPEASQTPLINRSSEEIHREPSRQDQPALLQQLTSNIKQHKWVTLFIVILVSVLLIASFIGEFRSFHEEPSPNLSTQFQELYSKITHQSPIYSDPLANQDDNNWSVYNNTQGENLAKCQFSNGAYHAIGRQKGYYPLTLCFAQAQTFANFALQVDMTLEANSDKSVGNGSGGLIYRAQLPGYSLDNMNLGTMYRVRINPNDRSYDFYVQNNGAYPYKGRLKECSTEKSTSIVSPNTSANIYQNMEIGANVKHQLTLIVKGAAMALFIEGNIVQIVCNSASQSGLIGFFVAPTPDNETNIAYTNMKVWKL